MKTLRSLSMALVWALTPADAQNNVPPPPPESATVHKAAEASSSSNHVNAETNPNKLPESEKGKFPFGTRIPGRPGLVYSPHDVLKHPVDIGTTAPGVIVKCPYTNKLFRVPELSDLEKRETAATAPKSTGTPPAKPAVKPAAKPEAAKSVAKDKPAGKPAATPASGPTKTPNQKPIAGEPKKLADEVTITPPPAPKPAAVPVRMLDEANAKMLNHLFVKGRPLVWIEQEPNENGRQTFLILEKRGEDVAVIFDWTCTTGRNLPEENGNSFPTPSTFDRNGNIGSVKIIRKDAIRTGSGLEWALELEFYDANDNLRGICIHKGAERFYPASHACIRLNDYAAQRVFNTMEIGDPVVITGSATVDNPYVTYVAMPGKTQKVPVFKIDLPMPDKDKDADGYAAFQKDLAEFEKILRLPPDDPKKMQLDHMPFGKESKDKNVVRFRFEHMPRGTGITMAKVETLLNMEMYVGPMVKRPPVKKASAKK